MKVIKNIIETLKYKIRNRGMPNMTPEIDRIILKLDSGAELTESEEQKLNDYEDETIWDNLKAK